MFRIGEFSKIARVSGRLLRYYDELGLLQPVKVDPFTGYRYYSLSQLPRLNCILALKDLGLTLDQIKQFIDDDISPAELRGMFVMKKAQIEQNLHDEVERLKRIEVRLEQIERQGTIRDYDVIVKSLPSRRLLAVTVTITSINHGFEIIKEMTLRLPRYIAENQRGNFLAVLQSEMYEEGELTMDLGYLLNGSFDGTISLTNGREMTVRELPAVDSMATAVRTGIQENALNCYTALGSWIEMNGYEIGGAMSELFLVMPPPHRPYEAVIETQIPLKKIANRSAHLLSDLI